VNPRWFEATDDSTLFNIVRDPVTLEDFHQGAEAIDRFQLEQGVDAFIPVNVKRSGTSKVRGSCTTLCFPRVVVLDLKYYQVDRHVKRLIKATLYLSEFDLNADDLDYTFEVDFYPLNYINLIVHFAFDQFTYIILFVVLGAATVGATMVYWLIRPPSLGSRLGWFP
jgi:hypothetical protein